MEWRTEPWKKKPPSDLVAFVGTLTWGGGRSRSQDQVFVMDGGEIEGKVRQSLILWSTCSLVNLLQYILSLSSGGCSTLCGPVSVGWWRWFLWISATSTRGWCWLALLMMMMACWFVGWWVVLLCGIKVSWGSLLFAALNHHSSHSFSTYDAHVWVI